MATYSTYSGSTTLEPTTDPRREYTCNLCYFINYKLYVHVVVARPQASQLFSCSTCADSTTLEPTIVPHEYQEYVLMSPSMQDLVAVHMNTVKECITCTMHLCLPIIDCVNKQKQLCSISAGMYLSPVCTDLMYTSQLYLIITLHRCFIFSSLLLHAILVHTKSLQIFVTM